MNTTPAADRELVQEKLKQATEILNELEIDLWLTFVRESSLLPDPALELIYHSDVTWPSAFLISRSGQHSAIVGFYDADTARALDAYDTVIGYHHGLSDHLNAEIERFAPNRIALNYSQHDVAADGLTHGNYQTLVSYLAGSPYGQKFESSERIISALRGRKTPSEVNRIREAIHETEQLFYDVEAYVSPGMSQSQIAEFVHDRIASLGLDYAWDKSYNPIVTCGPESTIGHVMPSDIILEEGHTLHMDLGVKKNGYCSDLQRMWYVLKESETEAPEDVQQAFKVVSDAIMAGESVLRPGVAGWQVDAAARGHIVNNGYPEFMHATGHLLGRTAHDGATILGPKWEKYAGICELPVEIGNVFTLELHVEVPGRGIMSLEEDVLVHADGVEYLSDPQVSLRYIRA
jgi:Xaa-Pro aminopeptidase